ncbi:Uncharacterised protein [Mycobacteroides abscessus subsp. abscessus]|nr:Uncharacterised protein [Mycobacteroides abscessus subsp. abscessus]
MVSSTKARPIPSRPTAYFIPNAGIQETDSTNWYCGPTGSKAIASPTATISTSSEVPKAVYFAKVRWWTGRTNIAAAPANGMSHSAVTAPIALTTSLPSTPRPPRPRLRTWTTRTSGRDRSAAAVPNPIPHRGLTPHR